MLNDSDEDLFATKTSKNASIYTPSPYNGPCVSLDTKSTVDSENFTPSKQIYGFDTAQDRSERHSSNKQGPYGVAVGEASVFSLFAPNSDDQVEQASTQKAPKLDAQTLFAFGVSKFGTIEF